MPWLPRPEQPLLFPEGVGFDTPQEQRSHILAALRERAGFEPRVEVQFYTGRYDRLFCSIIPVGDLTEFVVGEVRSAMSRYAPSHPKARFILVGDPTELVG